MNEFEHLKIQLDEIKKASNNFSNNNIIGCGGFGNVYKGEISHSKGRSTVAMKRLDRKFGQGDPEFLKEIMMLSRYTHKNLISLLGFCDENGEKILVYEYASNGSLDRYLSSTSLTWEQRFKICLDAAKGLSYLHDHKGTQQRVLHRDIKSANILLDHNWNAKISDMGLSKLGPANQLHTIIFTNVVGTPGYCDPQYMTTYTLSKDSDVYSFGVVLFEVLCGRLCFKEDSNHKLQILVPMWKESYKHNKLDEIIFKDLMLPMNKTSLETFAGIAFRCVHKSREQRPKMSLVVEKLETALKFQQCCEMKLPKKQNDEEIIKDVKTLPSHKYLDDHTSKGKRVLPNFGEPKREGDKQKDDKGSGGGTTKDRKGTAPSEGQDGRLGLRLWFLMAMVVLAVTFMFYVALAVWWVWLFVISGFFGGWCRWCWTIAVVVLAVAVGGSSGSWWWVVVVVVFGLVVVPVGYFWWSELREQRQQRLLLYMVVLVVVVVAMVHSSGQIQLFRSVGF